MKYIVVTGGVISGLGKGITASTIGLLLKNAGSVVTAIKIDPYLNIDAGTMSPFEHGECYVLADGGESDLDLGNYERFLEIELTSHHSITTGKIYENVLKKERNGDYLGQTVQIIPHITNEIQQKITYASQLPINSETPDVCIIELGGTIGDIEGLPFIEAIRQMHLSEDNEFCFVHVSKIIDNHGDPKTKPTQHSVTRLRELGICPDILVLRTSKYLDKNTISKLEVMCNLRKGNIIENIDAPNIYYVPKLFFEQKIHEKIAKKLHLGDLISNYDKSIIDYFESNCKIFKIGIAGKYLNCQDTYLSLIRAIEHSAYNENVKIEILWLDAENYDEKIIDQCHGIIIPGGFGQRGIEGKIKVAEYCRNNKIPLLGICLGMQIMVIEMARSLNIPADSTEWNPNTSDPIITIIPNKGQRFGGNMRLGNYETTLKNNSLVSLLYKSDKITERHRHRYEFNNSYSNAIQNAHLIFSGINSEENLVEVVELENHPFYVGCQYHPELRSRLSTPHPLFTGLIKALNNQ